MELRKVRHFVAVVSHGNFSRAAKQLHLTQPALSRQVQRLEQELGTALLKRQGNGVTPTYPGQILLDEAQSLLT
jgi:DNA-binding transcriptional LysR family regulator